MTDRKRILVIAAFTFFGWIAVTADHSVSAQNRVYGTPDPVFVRTGHSPARAQEAGTEDPFMPVGRFEMMVFERRHGIWLLDTVSGRTWFYDDNQWAEQ